MSVKTLTKTCNIVELEGIWNNSSVRLAWCVFLEQVRSVFPRGTFQIGNVLPSIDFYRRVFYLYAP